MPYNFLGLVNNLCYRMNETPLTSVTFGSAGGVYSDFKLAVNSALHNVNTQVFEWPFNHQTETMVLTPSQARYPYPSDAKTINFDSFRIPRDPTFNVTTTKLRELDYERYLEQGVDAEYANGELDSIPQYVSRAPNLEFVLAPPPREAYTLIYEYYAQPPALEVAADVPTVPEQFEYVINSGALQYAYQFRGDLEGAERQRMVFNEELKQMRTLYQNRYEYVRGPTIMFRLPRASMRD
jgi:hypothetical protein